jgi:cyclophilin family peptidyl-prolyl cis-trans isomerase
MRPLLCGWLVWGLTGGRSMGNGRGVNRLSFLRVLQLAAVCLCGLALFAVEARAVSLTLEMTNITTFAGQTFQMPLTASDPDGQPLKFSATVSNKKALTATIAPRSNRSLVMNVSGVDGNDQPFTGDMVLQLFEDLVPHTTARIIDLVNSNFYNGLLFGRVLQGFVAQAGASTNDPNFGSGVSFQDEYSTQLTYVGFGQLGMANAVANGVFDSDDSQIFITDGDLSLSDPTNNPPTDLNFQNGIFGQLTRGFDVLSEIMSTPVGPSSSGENSAPLSNVVINTATVITNSQDGVLRLAASRIFSGQVSVVVSAMNAERQSVSQTLQVTVTNDSINLPPFIGVIPTSIVLTQNTAATFIITTADVEGDPIFIGDGYGTSFEGFTNIVATIIQGTRRDPPGANRVWFSPDLALTGVVEVVLGVRDPFQGQFNFIAHQFSLTFLPWSASPTMMITSLKGTMLDGGKTNGDSVSVNGKFTFIGQSDRVFSSNDVLVLTLGNPAGPLTLTVTPDNAGVRFRNGSVNARAQVMSGQSTNVNVSAQFNNRSGNFRISVRNFDFPAAISNQVEVGIALGNDYVTDVRTWIEKSPGMFVPPP